MNKQQKLADGEKFFLALADKTRLRILNLMRDKEICVGFLVETLNESQPKISRHLAYLRSAGIVETRREGKRIYYKIIQPVDDFKLEMIRNTLSWLKLQPDLTTEFENLNKIYNGTQDSTDLINDESHHIFADAYTKKSQLQDIEIFLL